LPYDLALFDLISPYVLRGDTFGQWHAALSVIYVSEHTVAIDDAGIVIRGIGRYSGDIGRPNFDPKTMTLSWAAENTEGHPANDPGRRDPWIDISDDQIVFELSAPRVASQKVAVAVAAIGNTAGFAEAAAVLSAYDSNALHPPPSDFASTEFTLDLLISTAVLRPPFLRGAKLDPSGILAEDPTKAQVKITLPMIKLRLQQGSNANDPMVATLLSLGASGLDDQADFGVADLMTMDPPYAFIGSDDCVGIGFRTAILDLSDGSTPPDVIAQFGFDDSWTGLYLPELRIYVAPKGATGLACDASATNLLIGVGASAGLTGDFEVAIVDQGSGPVKVSARFYDATGNCYGITRQDDNSATVTIPDHTRMVVDIDGGLTPYTSSAKIGNAADTSGRLFNVDFGSDSTLTIVITAKGSQPNATPTTLTITAALKTQSASPPPGSPQAAGNLNATPQTTSITRGGSAVTSPQLKIVSQTSSTVTVALDASPPLQADWTINGTDKGTSETVEFDCAPGATVQVNAVVADTPGANGSFTTYYRFDHPSKRTESDPISYAVDPDHTRDEPAPDQTPTSKWPGNQVQDELFARLADVPAATPITILGYASFESYDNPTVGGTDWLHNNDLATNRAAGLAAIIAKNQSTTFTAVTAKADMSGWGPAQGDPGRDSWWKAVATWQAQTLPGTTTIGTVTRASAQPPQPVPVPDNPQDATPPPPPSWFKKVDAKVRVVRDNFVAVEVGGKFDIQTPSEQQLAQGGVSKQQMPTWGDIPANNPADGIIDVRVVTQIDDATDVTSLSVYFGADPADRDGLKYIGWLPPAPAQLPDPGFGQNFLGLGVAFWPLIATGAGAAAGDGAAVELAVDAAGIAVVAGMAALPWFRVEHFIWYGGELDVQARRDGTDALMLVDVEAGISAEISIGSVDIVTIDRKNPLIVRYKAIGFILGNKAGESKFPFRPYFDSSKGYTIDVSKPGAITVHDPFDKILKILGARLSRNNPFYVEVDLGFAVDLGVVSIDRARVRLNLSPGGPPEITAFGASVNIPGALQGKGYAQVGADAQGNSVIAGAIDLTVTPVNVRIAATLAVAQISAQNGGPATGIQVSIEVDFPVAIPLANSGLGIYGFVGLFAMNFQRDPSLVTSNTVMAPALAWLKATHGDVANPRYWVPKINSWDFGVGALIGTEGTDIIFNMKGMVLLELPGPNLLILMKANVLFPMPELHGDAEGLILAVIDLDFARGTMTIGLAIDFVVQPLIEINIPIEAFFDFNDTSDWHLYLGQYDNQVQAKVLLVFDASGYVMFSGNGIPAHNKLPAVTGFSIAAGLHVSFKWGAGPVYAELVAGFDAVIGFSPFRMAGKMEVRGKLHLFIVDISAWADLDVDVGEDQAHNKLSNISGDICGEVDFLFFSVSGCVHFTLSATTVPTPDPPDLVKTLKLVSRSPALVIGTGVDKPIDSGLADAIESDSGAPQSAVPVVPIDVVPVLMMVAPPLQDPSLTFNGQAIGGTPQAPSDGFVQRGDVSYKYTITKIELTGQLTAGAIPATWWNTKAGDQALEAQLALLSWVPDATPKAVGSSSYLDETTTEKWGTICQPAAPPAPIFYTFFFQPLGPSDWGWDPYGLAYPDPPNTVRSGPPDMSLHVSERWRCGDPAVDRMRGIVPAEVEGAPVVCPVPSTGNTGATASTGATRVSATAVALDPLGVAAAATTASATARTIQPPLVNNPIRALRGGTPQTIAPGEQLAISDVMQRFAAGQPVSGATLASLVLANAPAVAPPPPKCFGWALASPIFDDGELIAFGSRNKAPAIKGAFTRLHYNPGPLDDAVVFQTGAFEYIRFYLWIPRRFANNTVVVAASNANDQLTNQHTIVAADQVPPVALPATWTNPASPWGPAVFVLEELATLARDYVAVFVEIKGAKGFDRVQIGCPPTSRQLRGEITLRPFYVGGIELLKASEVARSSYDTVEQQKLQGVLQNALGLDSADNALLMAGQQYRVSVTWTCERKDSTGDNTFGPKQQTFWFQADSNPPARLDPWVMVALPGEAEQRFFAADPVKIVFASNNVGSIYAAYNKKLQARLRPSSFAQVASTPSAPHPYPLIPANLKPVPASILSPWENSVQKLAASSLPCVNVSGERTRHTYIEMALPLDLFTDYLIDIEMLDTSAADGSPGQVVWRGSFSTGGFRTAQDFAISFQIIRLNHRGMRTAGALQAIGTQFAGRAPEGSEFDDALIAAGLDALQSPKMPALTIFWDPGTPPQPAAILVDSSEPMWRNRPLPTLITDPPPGAAQRYQMTSQPWMDLVQQAGGDNIVDQIVAAPGGQRALVTLNANSRGKHIILALRRIAHTEAYLDGPAGTDQFYTILDDKLTVAPWEETD
jgi:hypothetical protein